MAELELEKMVAEQVERWKKDVDTLDIVPDSETQQFAKDELPAWLSIQDVLAIHKKVRVQLDPLSHPEYWYCQGCDQECSEVTDCMTVQAIEARMEEAKR